MVAESLLLPAYAELFCRSNFSFLHGASHAEELVERAVDLGYRGIAITDECSLAGAPRMHVAARAAGLPLIIGSYFEVTPDEAPPGHDPGPGAFGLVLLAQNREGYGNLSELISWRRMAAPKGTYKLTPRMLSRPPEEFAHLRGMPDCFAILVPVYPVRADVLDAQVAWFRATFGERARLGLVQLQRALDGPQREEIRAAGARRGVRVVALGDVTMHKRSCKPLQDVMTAIRLGMPVSECGYALAPNAEQHLRSRARIATLFSADEIAQTCAILDACHFSLKELEYEYPLELVPRGHTPTSYLRQETWAGVARRYWNGVPEKVAKQIRHELALIAKLNYEPFFLTVYDIVKFARSQNILCQGRGSAANSVVCYCLGITEVNPEQSTMLFERFISVERGERPDIDVDFEHQRREEVIQHIYKKYGKDRAALAAAVSTYRPRGVLREVGKALGVDPMLVDRVAKGHRWFDGSRDLLQQFEMVGLDPVTPLIRTWAELAARLLNFPRHLSQHSGGFVISRGKLTRLVPVENAAMDGRRVIQWDKDDLEALGLMKVDVLALGMLSALHRAFDMRTAWRGPAADGKPFTLKHIPQEDKATYDMICRADTVGVFQIESRAQMSMLPRLQPRTYYDLVIEVAIVRPGPIQGGAVHPYLRRRQGLEKISYPKDDLKPALERTMGVPIFQEQVMQIAMIAAGFTAGEADGLRRAMAAWKRKGDLGKYHDQIVNGMLERGYTREFAEQIFEQIKGFGEYGFPESHAASFAKLAYASSWLKCHEPAIFVAALLNSQPMGFYAPAQLVQDARRHGVTVFPVDVTKSNWETSLEALPGATPPEGDPAVRLGLSLVRGFGEAAARRIEAARAAGPFENVDALARRARLERRDLEALAAANALATLAGHRRDALWQAVAAAPDRDLLAAAPIDEAERPALGAPSEADEILADYDTTGLTLNRHPVALLRPALRARRLSSAAELRDRPDGRLARACGIVIARQMPGTAKGVLFMTLEDETGCVNVIVRPELLARQRRETLDSRLLAASGVWQVVSDVRHLVAQHFEDLTPLLGGLRTSTREFQ
ncbi:error-prone DNA polymerase [Burkholderia multivorans]|uniref:error-prone DNA polymerase n=1 Tax=Burkholderia multivorans TaxID=87883 RepID=UPI0005BC47C3|nr:error-prone DNA polymerase [Burkholderia multivorans]MBU9311155.1 error-prone DNA polymerase [Burkholderia multivorans]MBU9574569.1 error-prone DNA polymerase [Burkholderia multivorans]MDN7950858.1 error-prone DNA polymerase [Burkholderia multivorans]MDN7962661.1 error-prone DNA polymerase [Burkholderia multivorans]MDR9237469.1 Error-prone DNA polymerase [Burkholderia multivorans]